MEQQTKAVCTRTLDIETGWLCCRNMTLESVYSDSLTHTPCLTGAMMGCPKMLIPIGRAENGPLQHRSAWRPWWNTFGEEERMFDFLPQIMEQKASAAAAWTGQGKALSLTNLRHNYVVANSMSIKHYPLTIQRSRLDFTYHLFPPLPSFQPSQQLFHFLLCELMGCDVEPLLMRFHSNCLSLPITQTIAK